MQPVTTAFSRTPDRCVSDGTSMAVLGDALEVLAGIKDESIDLIFADPPYNIGKEFERGKWREGRDAYVVWCKRWIDESMRVLKPSGTMYLMAATQYMPYLDVHVDSSWIVKARIVWHYDSSGVQARRYFGSMYEPILMIVKDEQAYTFNASSVMVEAKSGARRNLIDYRKTPPQPYNDKKVMGNVWSIPRVRYKMEEYENHPTQKPERLLEIPVLASSNPGDIVLDPFAGSWTTCAVARRLGRRCIGIEIDEGYYTIGLRRLGLATEYNGTPLVKVKVRKTRNKSKRDHGLTGDSGNE